MAAARTGEIKIASEYELSFAASTSAALWTDDITGKAAAVKKAKSQKRTVFST